MVDTVGESRPNYIPVDQNARENSVVKKPGNKGFKAAVISFAASLAYLGATVTGHADTVNDATKDVAGHTADATKDRVIAAKNTWVNGTPDPNDPRNR